MQSTHSSEEPAANGLVQRLVDQTQRDAFRFFELHSDPETGLVRDSTMEHSPCSIAAVGMALSCYPIGVRRGWLSREQALKKSLAAIRFFSEADQSGAPDSSGYRGFFFHFLDMKSGRRAWNCELSTIDTALLVAGILTAAQFFDGSSAQEAELRHLATLIYERIDWQWAQNGGAAPSIGWTPEKGFMRWRWIGYSEALILYALALGSPSYPFSSNAYDEWLSGYRWKRIYGMEYLYAGPLFIHQFSHMWIDFRDIADRYMRDRNTDYFCNSCTATHVHREYAIRNPHRWEDYHGKFWGLTASNGPGPARGRMVHGRKRNFYGYRARGAPYGPDDGTVSPWAAIASLPFAPEIALPTIESMAVQEGYRHETLGFFSSFNPTWHRTRGDRGWICPLHVGLNQGPIVMMIENWRNGFLWDLMRGCVPIVQGLRRAGFRGGWLDGG